MGYNYIQEVEENFTTSVNGNYTLHEHDFTNEQTFISKLPAIVYTTILMTVGLPGNMVVLYIYFFRWRRSTSRTFILHLAAIDMVNCATTMPMEIYIMRFSFKMDQSYLCKLARFATYVMNSSSALILVGIAIDRYKRICRPYQRSFTEAISKRICIGAILISLGTTWPSLFLYGIRKIKSGKAPDLSCLLENQYDDKPYPMIYFCCMMSSTLLIFVAIAILYYFVGIQICNHRTFKLRNCTLVEKVIEDTSISLKLEKVNQEQETDADSTKYVNEIQMETMHNEINVEINEDPLKECYDNIQMPISLSLPRPCNDTETSSGIVIPPRQNECERLYNDNELIVVNKRSEANVKNVTAEHLSEIKQLPPVPQQSPLRRNLPNQNKTKTIRYLLVRGSSTLNVYENTNCTNCWSTVRVGRSTFVLFLITIAYILSFLPFYIIAIMRQTNSRITQDLAKNGGTIAYHVFLRSYLLSSAINPFIYSFCNNQFRKYCIGTFARLLMRMKQSMTSNSTFR